MKAAKPRPAPVPPLRLAIVGTGGMANVHAKEFAKIPGVGLAAVCDVDRARAEEFAARHGAAAVYGDFRALFADGKIDAVSNVTPDLMHAPISLAALAAGKHVLCEKPLATCYADAARMARAAKKAGTVNMVNFSYRNAPAIQEAARMVREGEIGEIVHLEAGYFQSWLASKVWGDWRSKPGWLWRLSTAHGSGGVLGDIGVHILDFATFPAGPIRSLQCRLKSFDALKGKRLGGYRLDANDSAVMHVELRNGALGVIHTTRWATGHANSLHLRLFGTEGAIRIDLDRSPDELEVCSGPDADKAAWRTVKAPPTPSIYERFAAAIRSGGRGEPDFARGAEIQKLLDACFESDRAGTAIRVG